MNEPTHKADELRQSIAEEAKALAEASTQANQAERDAKAELAKLRAEYQDLLFDLLMNRSDDTARKFELRVLIRGLEYDMADIDLLAEGFAAESARANGKNLQLRVMEKAVRTYNSLKDQLEAEGALCGLVEDLKLWAKKLDCLEDAESFLSALSSGEAA